MILSLYEVNESYIDYLTPFVPHLYHNKKSGQPNRRKYIGVVFEVNGFQYFAPLSSYKAKHQRMSETIDFLKIKDYAVVNLNNMFPVPKGLSTYVNISQEHNLQYKKLLEMEYRVIRSRQNQIRKNAKIVYSLKFKDPNSALSKRCNDFALLEKLCGKYHTK